jgi:hypothetical protein
MHSSVLSLALLAASCAAPVFAGEQTKASAFAQLDGVSQKSLGPKDARPASDASELTVVLRSTSDKYGSYGVHDGMRGPFWSAQGIWNASTKKYTGLTIAAGSATISGFSNTTGLLPGMIVEISADAMPANTTIVRVEPNSIVVSNPSTRNGIREVATFGLVNDGTMFNQVITNYPFTFPRRTTVDWSYPSHRNDASVYSYAIVAGYGIGTGGHLRPENKPLPKKVSEFAELSVTYDLSIAADPNDFALLVETFPTTEPDPSPPNVANTMTNEIGFFPHVPDYLWTYIRTLQHHFDYSSPDGTFHAYVATKPGKALTQFPPYTMIVPVTEARGRTPRDMTTGSQSLPVLGVLRELVARGVMPADAYVCGFDFGFEVGRNSGRATLNSIDWKWQ